MNPAGRTLSITVTEEGKQFHVDMGANLPTTIAKSRKGGSGVVRRVPLSFENTDTVTFIYILLFSSDIGNK